MHVLRCVGYRCNLLKIVWRDTLSNLAIAFFLQLSDEYLLDRLFQVLHVQLERCCIEETFLPVFVGDVK